LTSQKIFAKRKEATEKESTLKAGAHGGEVGRVSIPLLRVAGPAKCLQVLSAIRPAVVAGDNVIYFDAFFLCGYRILRIALARLHAIFGSASVLLTSATLS
jgi:hypothetical protein